MKMYRFLLLNLLSVFLVFSGCAPFLAGDPTPFLEKDYRLSYPPDQLPKDSKPLTLIYPKLDFSDSIIYIPALDSVFLLGRVNDPTGKLVIAGQEIEIHPGGGWIAWVGYDEFFQLDVDSTFNGRPAGKVIIRYNSLPDINKETDEYFRTLWFLHPRSSDRSPEIEVYPFSGKLVVKDNVSAKIRCGWPGTYDLFPKPGTVMWSDGYKDTGRKFYKVNLSSTETGWIEDTHVKLDSLNRKIKNSVIYSVLSEVEDRKTIVTVPLNGDRVPVRIERTSDNNLELTIYGAVSWTDLIIQPEKSPVVDELRWRQVDPTTWKLNAFIHPDNLWGYETFYTESGNLRWEIYHTPELDKKPLRGLTVLLDPGHGGDNTGAVGPTGIAERDATLALALKTEAELIKAGAKVILTRRNNRDLALGKRIKIAKNENADIILSLHYNAFAQGTNPHLHHGTSVHYNHRHSKELAKNLLISITHNIGWEGEGLRYQDLALPRATFCPSVLIETAFMSHPEEEALSMNPEFQEAVAKGIRQGLENWLYDLRDRMKDKK
jgi:N-acetylmuramoyl-L-alanine amidase